MYPQTLLIVLSCIHVSVAGISLKFETEAEQDVTRLYMNRNTLELSVKLVDSVDTSEERSLELFAVYNSSDVAPYGRIINSSWVYHFNMSSQNMSSSWNFTITRDEHIGSAEKWLPREQWKIEVSLDSDGEILTKWAFLLDAESEPILQWSLGTQVSGPPASVSEYLDQYLTTQSTCASDVALILPKYSVPVPNIYFARTHNAFDDVTWFELSAPSLCDQMSSANVPIGDFVRTSHEDCSHIMVLDAKLTNHHLALLTDTGLFVSSDMRRQNATQSRNDLLEWHWAVQYVAGCDTVQDATLSYTPHCHNRQHESFVGDVLTLTYTCNNGVKDAVYSHENFTLWRSLYGDNYVTTDDVTIVLDAVHHYHLNMLVILYVNQSGGLQTIGRQLDDSFIANNKSLYPSFTFPATCDVTKLVIHPDTHYVYAYGQSQQWFSSDSGHFFELIHHVTADDVFDHVLMSSREDGYLFYTPNSTYALYGKAGVKRLISIDIGIAANSSVLFDVTGNLVGLEMCDELVTNRSAIDTEALIRSNKLVPTAALAVLPVALDTLYLYEVQVPQHTTPYMTSLHEDKLLVHRSGGRGLVTSVTNANAASHVMSVTQIRLYEPFEMMRFTPYDVLQQSVDVHFVDQATGTAVLTLSSGPGWTEDYTFKTAVFPGNTPILLTQYRSATEFEGIKPFSFTVEDFTAESGTWLIMDFGYDLNTNESSWYLEEDTCQVEILPDPSLQNKTQTTLDLSTFFRATFLANTKDTKRQMDAQLYVTLSNPWVFRVETHLSQNPLPHYDNLTISLTPRVNRKGVVAVRIVMKSPSLRCAHPVHTIIVYAGCPCTKRLVYWYPYLISMHDFLYGDPLSKYGRKLVTEIAPNYRPPSQYGIEIPTNEHIYNAHPSLPRLHDRFHISKDSGHYKQCAGKENRSECGCTDEMGFTSDSAFSDCKQRVYRMSYPGRIQLNLSIEEQGKPSKPMDQTHIVTVSEINHRPLTLQVSSGYEPSTLQSVLSNNFSHLFERSIWDPRGMDISMNGSGLYHMRVEMIPGISFCELYSEFQVYIDRTPIAYPMMFVLNFAMAFVLGGVFFIIYLYYLSKHHCHRPRSLGEKCMDLHAVQQTEGLYPPGIYPPPDLFEEEDLS